MSGAKALLTEARRHLGLTGRPNKFTRAYATKHGAEYLSAAWCDMFVTYCANQSGNAVAVLPFGDRAYTVAHAEDGHRLGTWYAGTVDNIRRHAKPGCPIFFDWGGTNNRSAIDHIGFIEVVLPDGRVQTIEGNTGGGPGSVRRRVRGADVTAGFWVPNFSKQEDDVSAKEVWERELKVPYGSPENPEWQAGNILVNNGIWLRKVTGKVDQLTTMVAAQNATIKELAAALAARDGAIDVDALVGRIETAIQGITVHLTVDPADG